MADYRAAASEAARRHGIPENIFLRLVNQESGFNPNAVSPAGAIGLGQLMPDTARGLGVDPNDPLQNLEGAATYLDQQHNKFGDWRNALAAYNAGPGAVSKYGGVPPYAETRNYVSSILGGDSGMAGGVAGATKGLDVNALLAWLDQRQDSSPAPQASGFTPIDVAGSIQRGLAMRNA